VTLQFKKQGPHESKELKQSTTEYFTKIGVFFVFATTFGAIHLVVWHFKFPTRTELGIWRWTSVAITALPLIALGMFSLFWFIGRHDVFFIGLGYSVIALYALARLILLGQSLACFRSLPKAVYKATWADLGPHV
jgi:hypothetical protein